MEFTGSIKDERKSETMKNDLLHLALNNLKTRKLRSWLTMLGIFTGIAAVVALIGLGEGLRIAVISQFGFLGTDILGVQAKGIDFAGPPGSAVSNPLPNDLVDDIKRIKGVEAAINRYIESSRIEFNDRQEIVAVVSIPEGDDRKIFENMFNLKTDQGRLLKDDDNKKILLGSSFADEDTFGRAIESGDKLLINGISFEVVGIIEKKGSFFLDSSAFMNEDEILEIFGDDETVDVIGVKVKNSGEIENVRRDIEEFMRQERNVKKGEEDFTVESPQQILESLDSTLFAIQLFVTIIAAISLIVGGIGIMNTMYTSVLERTKEIGIMKSIGAKNSTIFTLFFLESGFLGIVGGLIGVVIGIIIAFGLAFIGRLALGSDLIQANVTLFLIAGSLIFSFTLGSIAGVLPALQASRLLPVEALRSTK